MTSKSTAVIFGLLLTSPCVYCYDKFEAGKAVGMYLTANHMLLQLKHSDCGYVLKKPVKSMSESIDYALSFLNADDRLEVANQIQSREFQTKLANNKLFIEQSILRLEKEVDKNTACGFVAANVTATSNSGFESWSAFLKKYNKK